MSRSGLPPALRRPQAGGASRTPSVGDGLRALLVRKPSLASRAEFARSLAVMVSARLPIVDALDITAAQTADRPLAAALADVAARVRRGDPLGEAFGRHPAAFGPLFANLVRVGEAAGALDAVLLSLAGYLERAHALRRRVRLALAYPVLVVGVAGAAVAFLLAVVVPTFADLFSTFGAELPLPTRVLIAASNGLRTAAPLLVVGAVALAVVGPRLARSARFRRLRERALLRLPGVGGLYRKALTARFARTLATLLGGGVPLAEALGVTAASSESPRVEEEARALQRRVVRGGSLAAPLKAGGLFPPMLAQMVGVGEETARLAEMLAHAAAYYEREVEEAVDALTTVIEPVLILILGVVVGGILIAIYLPMFDLVNVIE